MYFKKKNCLVLLLIIGLNINAQKNKIPKIGLCLSGGGAKGLAHIGLLKLIDSLGIKVDFITGTSMGSVVGGLYAAGYTGKQIDSIAHTIDWDLLLNQYVPMNDIYMDEKDEYGRYLGEIPIKKRKIQVTGFIEGQELLNTLMRLTKHVNTIVDFNKLPIPYKCMAIDIVNVKPVVMDRGNLAIAMRASMSIPTVFKPVKVDDRLLVDGGLMVNFPVTQLKEMGADIIIGSYTGGRLMEEVEMNTFDKLLVQSSSFYGIVESKDDIELCTIFNNLTDSMKQYGAGDFKKSNRIIETGNRLSKNVLPQLIKLSEDQKARGVVYQKRTLIQPNTFIKVEDIVIEPACDQICDRKVSKFIENRVSFKTGDSISFKDLEKTVTKIYGTRNFIKVYYILEPQITGNYIVTLKVEQDVKFRIKGALHYDTETGAGFILNVTARNWLGRGSRLTGTVDLSQTPKFRIHYRKYIAQSNFSFNTEYRREQDYLQWKTTKGIVSALSSYKDVYQIFNIGFNYNIAFQSSLYIGVMHETDNLTPLFDTDINTSDAGVKTYLTKYIASNSSGLVGQFRFNNLNRFVFPSKGSDLLLGSKLVLIPISKDESSIITNADTMSLQSGGYSGYSQHEEFNKSITLYSPYNILYLKFINLLPINNWVSLLSSMNIGLTYFNPVKFDTSIVHINYTDYYDSNGNNGSTTISDLCFNGGVESNISRQNFGSVWGFDKGELIENGENFVALRLGIQCEMIHKLFVTPAITYYYSSTSPQKIFKYIGKPNTNGNPYLSSVNLEGSGYVGDDGNVYNYKNTALLTYGLNIGYKSPIGPINFNISRNSLKGDERWRAYISIGYRF